MPSLEYVSRAEAERCRYYDGDTEIYQRMMRSREKTLLMSGPAGTGKTVACLTKLRECALKYPKSRLLLGRSVRKWLTQSALVTLEDKVLVEGDCYPDRINRDHRSEYRFKNGSRLAVTGFENADQVMSAEYDLAYILEATEISRDTAEKIGMRLRNGRMPYQQLLLDCNPGPPTHWLKQDSDAGVFPRLDTTHKDNPALFDPATQQWTRYGRDYMARLDTLTGNRRLRLRDGKWAQAEGVIYEEWSSAVHVIDAFPIPAAWSRYVVIDFGFSNPMVVQWWAEDEDGRLYLYRELFRTGQLVDDMAVRFKELSAGDPSPRVVIGDHDAEGRATWEKRTGLHVRLADKTSTKGVPAVDAGIQEVAERLRLAGDGKPRLFVFRDSLAHEPDAKLTEERKPCKTSDEMDGWIWDPGCKKGERPLKENDHGVDAMRYLCKYLAAPTVGDPDRYGTIAPARPTPGMWYGRR